MKRILRRGFQNFEILERQESHPEGTFKEFRDKSAALSFLRGFLRDSFNIVNLRKFLVKGLSYSGRRRLDDHKVLEQIARRLVSGQYRIAVLTVAIQTWAYKAPVEEEEPGPAPLSTPQEVCDVTNLMWSQSEARQGDTVKLTAHVKGIPDGKEVSLFVYEYDRDGSHDYVSEFPVIIINSRINVEWAYEYHKDTDEIPTQEEQEKYGKNYNPPEYFFTVNACDRKFGMQQESGLLIFRDWIEVLLTNGPEEPIPDEPYILYLPDGTTKEGNTNGEGLLKEEKIPPGRIYVSFPAYFNLVSIEDDQYKATETIEYAPSYISKDNSTPSVEETPADSDQAEIEQDTESFEEDEDEEWEEYIDSDELFEEPEEDDDDVEGIFSPYIPDPDLSLELREDYDLASKHCVTGNKYHLAVIYHLSVELFDENGESIEEPIQYQIKDRNGKTLYRATSDKKGLIRHSGIGMGHFELIIGDNAIWIASVPDLSMREQVILQDIE